MLACIAVAGLPALVAEIIVGMVMGKSLPSSKTCGPFYLIANSPPWSNFFAVASAGPNGLDVVSHVDALVVAGQLGLLLLVLEGGLHIIKHLFGG